MARPSSINKVVPIGLDQPSKDAAAALAGHASTLEAGVVRIATNVECLVEVASGRSLTCEVLSGDVPLTLQTGDRVLVATLTGSEAGGVVLGLLKRYVEPKPIERLVLSATDAVQIQCGESYVELRADGKVLIRGEDVFVRAKGTKRIRAGTVSIN